MVGSGGRADGGFGVGCVSVGETKKISLLMRNFMEVKRYHTLPNAAVKIREKVFMEEQGFQDEFDEIDSIAIHFVLFQGEKAIATCRLFQREPSESYLLGRYAVLSEFRRGGVGRKMMAVVEAYVRSVGGNRIALHAQCRVSGFYERLGFSAYGAQDEEEGCPHIWMEKRL